MCAGVSSAGGGFLTRRATCRSGSGQRRALLCEVLPWPSLAGVSRVLGRKGWVRAGQTEPWSDVLGMVWTLREDARPPGSRGVLAASSPTVSWEEGQDGMSPLRPGHPQRLQVLTKAGTAGAHVATARVGGVCAGRVGPQGARPAPSPWPCPAAVRPAVPGGPSPQVGAIGDEEEWVRLYEEENEPDAQTLEIPNLTPYTHYR